MTTVTATAEYSDIEAALITLLDEALTDVDVIAYPESDAFPGVKRTGLLIVGDAGDNLDDPPGRSMGHTFAQSGSYGFTLDLYVKELRGPHGIREIIRQIRNAVSGQAIAGRGVTFAYRGARPVKKDDSSKVWNYEITVDANYKLFSR